MRTVTVSRHLMMGVALLLTALLATACSSDSDSPSSDDGDAPSLDGEVVETDTYRVVLPTDEPVENTGNGEGSIVAKFEMPYGTVRIQLFESSFAMGEATYNGEVSESTDTVAGVETERLDQDTRGLYPFTGDEPLIGYVIRFESFQTPDQSGDDHHKLSLELYGIDEPSDDDVEAFTADMEDVIASIEID